MLSSSHSGECSRSHRLLRVLVVDQLLARVAAVHADQPVEHEFQVAGRGVPVDRADDRPGVRQVEPGVQVEVPHQVRLVGAVLLVAVARPAAERHRGRDAGVAALDLRAAVDVAEVLQIDLPILRQPLGHAEHEGARPWSPRRGSCTAGGRSPEMTSTRKVARPGAACRCRRSASSAILAGGSHVGRWGSNGMARTFGSVTSAGSRYAGYADHDGALGHVPAQRAVQPVPDRSARSTSSSRLSSRIEWWMPCIRGVTTNRLSRRSTSRDSSRFEWWKRSRPG